MMPGRRINEKVPVTARLATASLIIDPVWTIWPSCSTWHICGRRSPIPPDGRSFADALQRSCTSRRISSNDCATSLAMAGSRSSTPLVMNSTTMPSSCEMCCWSIDRAPVGEPVIMGASATRLSLASCRSGRSQVPAIEWPRQQDTRYTLISRTPSLL